MKELKLLKEYLAAKNLELSDKKEEQFYRYFELLVERNKDVNLTAITEFDEVQIKHFVDSISLLEARNLNQELTVVDIGTGAGFPGIPLKIMFPELKVTLMDALAKRIDFLNEVIEELGLENIEAIHIRAEDAGREPDFRDNFDLCVSRAVAELRVLLEYCLPLVKVGGEFISYKANGTDLEIENAKNAINLLGGEYKETIPVDIGDGDAKRNFVVVKKMAATDEKYPRRAGKVTKKPL